MNRSGGMLFSGERVAAGAQAINMLEQVILHGLRERIEHDVHSFPTGKLCGWDEITVAGNQDNLVDLMLEGKGGHVDSDFHVYTFLPNGELEVLRREIVRCHRAGTKLFDSVIAERIHSVTIVKLAEAKSELPLCLQAGEKFAHPSILRCRAKVYGMLIERVVDLLAYGRTVVIKNTVQIVTDIVLMQVTLAVCNQSVGSDIRRMLTPEGFRALAEETAVNKDRRFGHNEPPFIVESPWSWRTPDRGGSIPRA